MLIEPHLRKESTWSNILLQETKTNKKRKVNYMLKVNFLLNYFVRFITSLKISKIYLK